MQSQMENSILRKSSEIKGGCRGLVEEEHLLRKKIIYGVIGRPIFCLGFIQMCMELSR